MNSRASTRNRLLMTVADSHLYIALFPRQQAGSYDWVLANPASSDDFASSSTTLHSVAASPRPAAWSQCVARFPRADEPGPVCVIQLPRIAAPRKELQGFLLEQPAEQGLTLLLDSHVKDGRWTAAQWVVRVLGQLVEAELLELPTVVRDPAAFYRRVNALGLKAQATLELEAMEGRPTPASETFRRVGDLLVIPHNYAD